MRTNDQLSVWDRETFFHPSTSLGMFARGELQGRIIETAHGSHITDRDGNEFLDAFAGLYCVNAGYGRTEITDAIAEQAKKLAYYHAYVGHGTEVSITLAKMIIDRAPDHMGKVYFGLGGSDANETNIKLVWYYNNVLGRPNKKKIISRWRGYHGSGIMSGSLTGLKLFHQKFDLPLEQVLHTMAPYYLRRPDRDMSEREFSGLCARELEALIAREGADNIAAFIAEPVLGTGGIVPPPEGYWEAIVPVLKENDILLIADEVVTGFGRIGVPFASPHYGLEPDLITIAKGLTSAYAPLSGSIVSKEMYEVLMQGTDETGGPIGHGWTYSAHPIGAAAGIANLEVIDRLNLVENAARTGPYLTEALSSALEGKRHVAEVRGVGMLSAVELMEDAKAGTFYDPPGKLAGQVAAAMVRRGVIARAMPEGDIIGFAPPLSLTPEEADTVARVTAEAIDEVLG